MGWIVLLLIIGLVLVFISMYNRLVTARNAFKNAFAQIDVQLTRRYDLIPNLVEIAKGYIKHERETLEAVIKARNQAYEGLKAAAADPANATAVQHLSGADQQLGGALGRLMAVAEAYPDLKANQNFLQLQDQLANIEGELQGARRYYNATVRDLNSSIQSFPAVLVAGPLGFREEPFYADEDQSIQTAPKVSFAQPAA